jgi:arylsulfatase A-like enzyme
MSANLINMYFRISVFLLSLLEILKKNNFLFMYIRTGWSDISFGEANAITPNIHKLAMEGIILNNSYSYSMCTP